MNLKTALLVATLGITVPALAAAEPVKLFLFTKPSPGTAVVDEQLKARQESLREITKALNDAKYRDSIAVVQSRDAADVIVELVSRGETTRSSSSSSTRSVGVGGTASAARSASETKRHLKFLITITGLAEELTTEGPLPWGEMAQNAARDIAKLTEAKKAPSRPGPK
jgi:hypothetical protein